MDKLYEKIIELLSEIPEIRYIDLNAGQLQLEKPPLAYPAVLVQISETAEEIDSVFQQITGRIELTVVNKYLSETNSLAPEAVRQKGLEYMKLNAKINDKLQGYRDKRFEHFTALGKDDRLIRAGLKTIVQSFETSWHNELTS